MWDTVIHFINDYKIAVFLNLLGSILLSISTQFGSSSGWGGSIGWKSKNYKRVNAAGWVLLVVGFGVEMLI